MAVSYPLIDEQSARLTEQVMLIARLVVAVRRLARTAPIARLRGLHTAEQMGRILERERARTDRSGDGFSLLAFAPPDRRTARATHRRLARILKRRLRWTDEVGWLDGRCIGAMLPCTPPRGAWKVAEDVCSSFPPHVPPPHCTVYEYPSEQPPDDQTGQTGQNGQGRSGRPAPSSNGGTPGARSAAARPDRPVRRMEPLFVQKMPRWKRCLDVIGASLGIVVLSPLLAVVAVAVKVTSPGPVLFRQYRSGLGGKPFVIYKFRSMTAGAEAVKDDLREFSRQDGPAFKMDDDPRVTCLGRLLRKTSIDELPQLWNVLKGEMSLVGPRPLPCDESESCGGWYRRRLDVTPGLTCIWQVRGRSAVPFDDWVRMDIRYIRTRSLGQDVKLIVQTVPAVVLRRGAS